MKKIAVFTSGGDAPGMNACIRAVVRTGIHYGAEVFGIMNGYEGLINGEIIPMDYKSVANVIQRGGTILRTSRSERFKTKEGRAQAMANLRKYGIEGIVAIGGDGTFTGAKILCSEYPELKMMGTPGTIDNDLFGTDFTIGFDTAVNTALDAIDRIRDTAESHGRTFFIEVMGRDSGFIAMYAGIGGGAETILIPETHTRLETLDSFFDKAGKSKKAFSIVVVAEGDEMGGALEMDRLMRERHPGLESRVTILGHIQRGGKPTAFDRMNASMMGVAATEALLKGDSGKMAGVVNGAVQLTPFEEAIGKRKEINQYWLHLEKLLG